MNPPIADFIRQGLAEAGYAIDVAKDCREGRNYALAAEYDVLVLDTVLPHLDGLALLR
jgi:DNA-binding response OmpR family regulator